MPQCILLLVLACNGATPKVINVVHLGAAIADTYSTQRVIGAGGREVNPVAKPFQSHGAPLAYGATVAYSQGMAALSEMMRHHSNRVIRKLWWVPQIGAAGVHILMTRRNLQFEHQLRGR